MAGQDPTGNQSVYVGTDFAPMAQAVATCSGDGACEQQRRQEFFNIGMAVAPFMLAPEAIATWTVRGAWVAVSESMSARALAFQVSQGGRAGMAFLRNGVKFDAIIGRTLIEAKSSLANFIGKDGAFRSWFRGADALASQAQRQLNAARGLNITWKVEDAKTAGAINRLFKSNGINGIEVEVVKTGCLGFIFSKTGGC